MHLLDNKIQLHQDECHAEELKLPGGSALSLDLVGLTTRIKQLSAEGWTTSFAPVHVVIRRIRRHVEHLLAECSTMSYHERSNRVNRSDGLFLRGLMQTQMYQKYQDDGLGSSLANQLVPNPAAVPTDHEHLATTIGEDTQLKTAQKTATHNIAQATKILFRIAITGSTKELQTPNLTTSNNSATSKIDDQAEESIIPSRLEGNVEHDSPCKDKAIDIVQDTASNTEDLSLSKVNPIQEKSLKASATETWADSFSISEINVLELLSSKAEFEPVSTKCSDSKTASLSSLVPKYSDEGAISKSNENHSRTDLQKTENIAIAVAAPASGYHPTQEQDTLENTGCMDLAWLSECLEAEKFDDCKSFDSDDINVDSGVDSSIFGTANPDRWAGDFQPSRSIQEIKEASIKKIQSLWRHWKTRQEHDNLGVENLSHASELEITGIGRHSTQESLRGYELLGVCILVHMVSPKTLSVAAEITTNTHSCVTRECLRESVGENVGFLSHRTSHIFCGNLSLQSPNIASHALRLQRSNKSSRSMTAPSCKYSFQIALSIFGVESPQSTVNSSGL